MRFSFVLVAAPLLAAVSAENNGLGRVPALGFSSWCVIGECGTDYCYEQEFMDAADALVANGMRDVGFHYIVLDDCWGYPRDPVTAQYRWDPDRFPGGMPALIQYVNQRGFDLGLYTDSGEYTCSTGGRPFQIPGSYGHYAEDAATFASWGARYVKMDWCNTDINGTQLDPTKIYPIMSQALNATGIPMWFESCEWGVDNPWEWAGPWMNSWRIGGDHHDTFSGNAPPSTEGVIELFANKSQFAGPGGWNYGDMIYTGGQGCAGQTVPGAHCPGQTDDEYRTEFTMWTMAASPIIVATNIMNMTDIMKEILLNADMIRVHQDPAGIPGDRKGFANNPGCPQNYCQIWSRPLANGDIAAVLYNRDTSSHNITMPFSMINASWATASASLYDLWQHTNIGTFAGNFSSVVAGHGVVAVRMTKVSDD